MFFKKPDLTSGSRPELQHDETLLFVQNNVGLYEGRYKVADCQNGHVYLTSHRACYIDDPNPRQNSLAIELKDVERHEYQAGFLRSSPKVTVFPKPLKRGPSSVGQSTPSLQGLQRLQASSSPGSRSASPFRSVQASCVVPIVNTASWICPICTFTNPVPSNFDPSTASESFPLPPCLTCGIKPALSLVLKAAISGGSSQSAHASIPSPLPQAVEPLPVHQAQNLDKQAFVCPRCTFHNHPSLRVCEMCGSALPATKQNQTVTDPATTRPASPAPEINHASESDELVSVKFSFRAGGDKIFYERLKGAMVQRKWLATNAPPVPKPLDNIRRSEPSSPVTAGFDQRPSPRSSRVGIAGLEQLGKQNQKDNELVIGSAFEDLESLMALEKEVSALAQRIAREFGDEANSTTFDVDFNGAAQPGIMATRDMLSNTSEKLYISELARNMAEYVTDERRGLLRRRGGVMSLVDLWATFNRSRDGVEMVSPSDFQKAASLWTSLGLPVRLRQFKSGLLAVQSSDTSDEKTIVQLKKWLDSFKSDPKGSATWDWAQFGCGMTAQDAAQKFGWSLGIANEELEMAEEKGVLCREESIEGLKFWLNFMDIENENDVDT